MLNNPLIDRYRYSSFRKRQVIIYATLYISVIILLLFINYSIYINQQAFGTAGNLHRSLYFQFITFQVFLLCLWGAYNSGSVIKDEILGKSYDFFRMLPIQALDKGIGILVGKNLVVLLMAGINLFFVIFFGMMGRVSLLLQVQMLVCMIAIALLANTASLLASISSKPKAKSSNVLVIIFAGFFIFPYLFAGIYQLSEIDDLQLRNADFYWLSIPVLVLISAVTLYFAGWAVRGIVHKFNHENEPLFTTKGAFLFTLGYELVILGFFIQAFNEMEGLVYFFWLATMVPLLLVVGGSLKGLENYIEHSKVIEDNISEGKSMKVSMLLYSNLFTWLGVFAIWVVFAIIGAVTSNQNMPEILHSLLVIFSSFLFVILMMEVYCIYKSSNPKIGLLVGFIVIMYLILPLIFGGIFDNDNVYLFSPFGYFFGLLPELNEATVKEPFIWGLNFLLCVIPALIIRNQYKLILEVREILSTSK